MNLTTKIFAVIVLLGKEFFTAAQAMEISEFSDEEARSIEGMYVSDEACIPSSTCCCTQGLSNITIIPSSPAMLKVQSELLEGNGCDELFSDYDGVLELINKTHSRASVFVESLSLDIEIFAVLNASSSSYKVHNSLNRKCVSSGTKVARQQDHGETDDHSRSSTFTGTWLVNEDACTAEAQCCCAVGELSIEAGQEQDTVRLRGKMSDDGIGSCFGRTDFDTTFQVDSKNSASYTDQNIGVSVFLNAEDGRLNFTNTLYPKEECMSKATLLTSSPVATKTLVEEVDVNFDSTADPPNVDKENANPRDFEGWFADDGSCIQSSSCCCGTGLLHVEPSKSNSSVLSLRGSLEGGLVCFYLTESIGQCEVITKNVADCAMELEGIDEKVHARLLRSDQGELHFSSSFYEDCPTGYLPSNRSAYASSAEQHLLLNVNWLAAAVAVLVSAFIGA